MREKKDVKNAALGVVTFLGMMYALIGAWSMVLIAMGEDIPYIAFWHEPWRLVLKFLIS